MNDPVIAQATMAADSRKHVHMPTLEDIAAGCEDGTIFADMHLEKLEDIPKAFPVITRMQKEIGPGSDVGMLWQYRSQATREVNEDRSYPVFHSVRLLSVADATIVHQRVRELRDLRLRRELGWFRYNASKVSMRMRVLRDGFLRKILAWAGVPDPTAPTVPSGIKEQLLGNLNSPQEDRH